MSGPDVDPRPLNEYIKFTAMRATDAPEIFALGSTCIELDFQADREAPSFYDEASIARWADSNYRAAYVARDIESDGKLAGFVLGQILPGSWEGQINALAVDANYRRLRIGTGLAQLATTKFSIWGCDRFTAVVNTMDNAVINMLAKMGAPPSREVYRYASAPLKKAR